MPWKTDVVSALYEASHDPEAWSAALAKVAMATDGAGALLALHERVEPTIEAVWGGSLDPRFARAYIARFTEDDYRLSTLRSLPVDAVLADSSADVSSRYRTSRQFLGSLRPEGLPYVLTARVAASEGSMWVLNIFRGHGAGAFGAGQIELLRALLPYLRRALILGDLRSRRTAQDGAIRELLDRSPFGIVVLDGDLGIALVNSLARAVLQARDGLGYSAGKLEATQKRQAGRFNQLLHRVADNRIDHQLLRLPRGSGKRDWVLTVTRLAPRGIKRRSRRDPAIAVFISSPMEASGLDIFPLLELYGLTDSESQVAEFVELEFPLIGGQVPSWA